MWGSPGLLRTPQSTNGSKRGGRPKSAEADLKVGARTCTERGSFGSSDCTIVLQGPCYAALSFNISPRTAFVTPVGDPKATWTCPIQCRLQMWLMQMSDLPINRYHQRQAEQLRYLEARSCSIRYFCIVTSSHCYALSTLSAVPSASSRTVPASSPILNRNSLP